MSIGTAIKLCRERKKITRSELAKLTQLSLSYLSLLENNKRDPNVSKVGLIADALGVPLSVLFFLAADKREFETISPDLAEKLALLSLKLIETSNEGRTINLPL